MSKECMGCGELRAKLRAAHRELLRRHDRDQELALHLPVIATRLRALAAHVMLDLCERENPAPDPAPDKGEGLRWERDPEIDWQGIDGGDARR